MWSVERPLAKLNFCGVFFPKGRLRVAQSRLLYPKVLFWKLRKDAMEQEQLLSLELRSQSHAGPGQRALSAARGNPQQGARQSLRTPGFIPGLSKCQPSATLLWGCVLGTLPWAFKINHGNSDLPKLPQGQTNPLLSPVHLSGALPTFCNSCGSQE